jgi:hypothetical protein
MNQVPPSPPIHRRSFSRVTSLILASLSFGFFLIGSIFICLTWVGIWTSNHLNSTFTIRTDGSTEGNSIVTILLLVAMLFFFWLLGTGALLFAQRWIAAIVLLPVTLLVFVGIYLYTAFGVFRIPGGSAVGYALLLIPLNILLARLTWWLMMEPRDRLTTP